MRVKCRATAYKKTLSDATATVSLGEMGEFVNAYCPRCENHHPFDVLYHGRKERR